MKIEVNLTKTKFFILLGAILLLAGIFVVYAFGGSQPSIVGHSVGEIDWSSLIQSIILRDLRMGYGDYNGANPYELLRLVSSQGNVGGIMHSRTGDYGDNTLTLFSYNSRDILLRAPNADIILGPSGDSSTRVGVGTATPTSKLDVNGNTRIQGDLNVLGKISDDNACTVFINRAAGSANPNGAYPIPSECQNNECLIIISANVGGIARTYASYNQNAYTTVGIGPLSVTLWEKEYSGGAVANGYGPSTFQAPTHTTFTNGDGISSIIVGLEESNHIYLYDDRSSETSSIQWYLDANMASSVPYDIVVCR